MKIARRTVPLRIHPIFDDHSRYIVAIAATMTTEREVEMLSLLVKGDAAQGPWSRGALSRQRIDVHRRGARDAVLAPEHRPSARDAARPAGAKRMERFWRMLREGCIDHLAIAGSLHDGAGTTAYIPREAVADR